MTHRLHVVGLPYLPVRREFTACAFTSRVFKFCDLMTRAGHEVLFYGAEGSNPPCAKSIVTVTEAERKEWYGELTKDKVYCTSTPVDWSPQALPWQLSNIKAAYWINRNLKPRDFVCLIGGTCQKQIADQVDRSKSLNVEFGIGYLGSFANHRVFDSYAHMHQVYGRESAHMPQGCDGRNFDAVIPCPYYLEDFTPNEFPSNYCLFVGRMDTTRKGIRTAVEATRRAGVRLILAGQGVQSVNGKAITCNDGSTYVGDHLQYHGPVNAEERNRLMRNAVALLAPTEYIEPFGGVNVEAQLCGTPAITTDFGAFPETVEHGVSGYRCRTLEQFEWAVRNTPSLDRGAIARRARSLWSMERVGRMYAEYFDMLATLWGDGWNAVRERSQLDWLAPMKGVDHAG